MLRPINQENYTRRIRALKMNADPGSKNEGGSGFASLTFSQSHPTPFLAALREISSRNQTLFSFYLLNLVSTFTMLCDVV